MARCTIKTQAVDGLQVLNSEAWCGRVINPFDWAYKDAQHLALSVGGSVQPCEHCIEAIIKELQKELD